MNNKTIGDRIKYHRKRLGLTQEQLAERLGVSPQAVSKWENNLSCPDISILPELSGIFGITIDALLGNTAEPQQVHEAELVEEKNDSDMNFSWQWESKKGGILFACFILVVGGLMLAGNLVPAMKISWWTILWTTALIFIGLSGMVGQFSVFCLAMTLAGCFFLLSAYSVITLTLDWGTVVAAMLLLWGVSLLADVFWGKHWRKKERKHQRTSNGHKLHSECNCDNGYLHCEQSFGESRSTVATPILRGGSIDSSFGDFTVDFSACEALAPECTLDVSNSFGSLTLLIPDKFAVRLEQKSTFAAVPEIKGTPAEKLEGTLCIRASLSFGAMEIRYV